MDIAYRGPRHPPPSESLSFTIKSTGMVTIITITPIMVNVALKEHAPKIQNERPTKKIIANNIFIVCIVYFSTKIREKSYLTVK